MHKEDQPLLAINWRGTTYIDHALPFGLRSAPKIFTAVADGYARGLISLGFNDFVHYLDDFLFWSPSGSSVCLSALQTALRLGEELGLPAAPGKVEGPSTSLTFLGIEIDTVDQVLRLPDVKLAELKRTLHRWQSTKKNNEKGAAISHRYPEPCGSRGSTRSLIRPEPDRKHEDSQATRSAHPPHSQG